jgi:macrodomain Ter protein organizer (MatP/YcbG family)
MMGLGRKKLTQSDYLSAYNYIAGGMDRDEISSSEGYNRFRNADTPEKLQAWCDDYLTKDQWDKMRNAIRVERKRSKDYKTNRQKIRVDLDWLAWQRLSSMAEEEGRTLSEMILAFEDVYVKAKAKGIRAGV